MKAKMKNNKFFVVGTPIGNFQDITLRALDTLKKVDIIACEDTRVTLKLLNYHNIKNKKLISYHNFNEKITTKKIIDLIKNKNLLIALVSDAGMPTISDPGFEIIKELIKENIEFEIIPGVSSVTTAFAASNLSNEFTFLGFGKNKKNQMKNLVANLKEGTYIFFSTSQKIEYLLDLINEYHCNNHQIFIAREMTKKHETLYRGKCLEVKEQIKKNLFGEFTIVLKIEKIKKQKINKYAKN